MKGGIFISGLAHTALILLAIWGLPRTEQEDEVVEFSQVEIISVAAFDAIRSAAPAFEEIVVDDIAQPEIAFNPAAAPAEEALPTDATQDLVEAPSEQDEAADLSDIATRVVEPDVAVDVEAPVAQEDTETAFLQPEASPQVETPRTGAVNISRPPAPRQPPQIDTSEAPLPPEEVEPEEVPEEVAPEEVSEPVEETPVEPEEPEVVEEPAEPVLRPQRRPDNIADLVTAANEAATAEAEAEAQAEARRIVEEEEERLRKQREEEQARLASQQVETPEPEPEPQPDTSQEDAEAERIAAALNDALNSDEPVSNTPSEAETTTVPQNLPVGAQLSLSEREGLRLAVEGCWSPPSGVQGAENLQVTVAIELGQDGKIVRAPERISPTNSSAPGVDQAFEAAVRALIMCGKRGFSLPADKFAQWQYMEITFDPSGMVGW